MTTVLVVPTHTPRHVVLLQRVWGAPRRASDAARISRPHTQERRDPLSLVPTITIRRANFLTTQVIKPSSVDLIVTSPPYNVGKPYATPDDLPYTEYLDLLAGWLTKAREVARPDGRLCLNLPLETSRNGDVRTVAADVTHLAQRVGWHYRTTLIWYKGMRKDRRAWGTFASARAPHVAAPVEVILVFYKEQWRKYILDGVSDTTPAQYMTWANGLWTFRPAYASVIGHPAPFPLELPRRCIKLFSYVGDTVLDPFVGSGTTLMACVETGRRGIGLDIDPSCCALARRRVEEARERRAEVEAKERRRQVRLASRESAGST